MTAMKMEFRNLIRPLANDERVCQMKRYTQHGTVSTYGHCVRVAYASYRIAKGLRLNVREQEMVNGALLHDYFLYDWNEPGHTDHAYGHAGKAADNARRDFEVSDHEYDIIRTHMWPICPSQFPETKEAAIVCVADKLCSLEETLFRRRSVGSGRSRVWVRGWSNVFHFVPLSSSLKDHGQM